jgi:hypothetical protein
MRLVSANNAAKFAAILTKSRFVGKPDSCPVFAFTRSCARQQISARTVVVFGSSLYPTQSRPIEE